MERRILLIPKRECQPYHEEVVTSTEAAPDPSSLSAPQPAKAQPSDYTSTMSTGSLAGAGGKSSPAAATSPAPSPAASPSSRVLDPPDTGIEDLPKELLEEVLARCDGTALCQSRLVCTKWASLIDHAPPHALPKVEYRVLTVTAQRGLEIILEKFADEAVLDKAEISPPATPPPKRQKKGAAAVDTMEKESVEERGRKVMEKQKRPTLTRTRTGRKFKITDRLTQSEMPHLMKYFRHIDADKLVLQSLSGKGLMTMLLILKRLCLRSKNVVLDFCNFKGIKAQLLWDFLVPRQGGLEEVQLSSCREMGTSFTPAEFWQGLGGLSGPFPTLRLKDHYSNSPWLDELATLVLGLEQSPWMLDLDGVSPPQEAIHGKILRWYSLDPTLGPIIAAAAARRNAKEDPTKSASPEEAAVTQAAAPPSAASATSGPAPQTLPSSSAALIRRHRRCKKPSAKPRTRASAHNFIIKFDNSRGIRLGRFWNDTLRLVLTPNDIGIQPEMRKVLEQCFDGRARFSTHRNRMILARPDGARFSIYLQR